MGLLVDGHWTDRWYDNSASGGRFQRHESTFRNWVTADGAPGPSGEGGFKAEPGRYHLYVSLACPWAHRTLIFRALKGLEQAISLSVVHWLMGENGWKFDDGPGVIPDPIGGAQRLYDVYLRSNPTFTGRVTVPVLWDKERDVIVSNESSEIIRMMNSGFDEVGAAPGDFYPMELRNGSMPSTPASTPPSTTVFTRPGLRQRRRQTSTRCSRYSRASTASKESSRPSDISAASA